MQLREINQHHMQAIVAITSLILVDSFSYYMTYIILNNNTMSHVDMSFPLHAYFVVIGIIYLFKNYNPSPRISRWNEAKIIIQTLYTSGILYTFGMILSKGTTIDQSQYILLFLHLFLILDISLRVIVRSLQRLLLRKGIGGRSTIVLGAGEDAQHLANELLEKPTIGFELKGYFHQYKSKEMSRYCQYLGNLDDIYIYIQTHNIHEMIVAMDDLEHEKLFKTIGHYEMLDICIKIIPDIYELIRGQARIDMLNGIPLMDINPDIMTEFQSIMKRAIDIVLSLSVLLLLLPLCMILAISIGFRSSGGIFYKQTRLGKDSMRFNLYKFRTMYSDSEAISGPIWAEKNDQRITTEGRFLRKFHLDEIPQLYNVLKGDMSIVGPRPERPQIINELIKDMPYYIHRMKIKPGITGWAQITGKYDATSHDVRLKLKQDFYYIENISLFLDFKIILLTVIIVMKGKGN